MSFRIPRLQHRRIGQLFLLLLAALALSSCQLLSLFGMGTSIDARIKMFNSDLATYNWTDLVKQFSSQTKVISSGTLNANTAQQYFSNTPFSQADNPAPSPGQIVVQSENSSTGAVTASYTNGVGGSYTLAIKMVTDSSGLNWYVLSITFVNSTFPAIQHAAPTGGGTILPKTIG